MNVIVKEVDDRALVLALDHLYRDRMKVFEVANLLPAARKLIEIFGQPISTVPIEGYYNESEELKEYFLNIRALQRIEATKIPLVKNLDEYQLLLRVMSSKIFGITGESMKLFPTKKDSLYFALDNTLVEDWNVKTLTEKARTYAFENDDISLVGIAASIADSVVLAATRESTVLYVGVVVGSPAMYEPPKIEYVWNVSSSLEARVNRFIDTFNELTSSNIKTAHTDNVEYFYHAFESNKIFGRCVRIGYDDTQQPAQNYHWAIKDGDLELVVDEFWHPDLWTTERYYEEGLWL